MPGRPTLRRGGLAVLLAVAAAAGLTACGTDETTAYADGWDGVCEDVGSALGTFRTAVSTAATTSPDAGDDAVAGGPDPAAVTTDLLAPAVSLEKELQVARRTATELRPPDRWAAWHRAEAAQLVVRLRTVDAGVRRLREGDADALPLLAVGGFGPSSVHAPAGLRDRTPECTALR
jgi:hypothetical protein